VAARPSMHRTRSEEVMSVVGVPEVETSVCVFMYVCVCVSCEWNPGVRGKLPTTYPRSYGTSPPPTHTHTKIVEVHHRAEKSLRKLLRIVMMYEVLL